jgi:uncharacterized membrane protein YesL
MPQLKLPSLGQPGFDLVFGYAYTGLAANLCLAAANAPLAIALVVVRDPGEAWPFFLLLSLTLAPSLAGAFAAFEAANGGGTAPFREFWRGWRRSLRPALAVGLAVGALVLVVGLDLATTAGSPVGALITPVLVLVAALAVAAGVLALTALATGPSGLRALAQASVYLAVRRWPLSLLSLAALVCAAVFALAQPTLGVLLGASPLLFVAFSNARASLTMPSPARG